MRDHGFDYLIATVLLGGVLQILLGVLGVAKLMRFIPRSVMVGFVNSLAILIFLAQVPHLRDVPWPVYPLVAIGIAVMVLLPRVSTAVPAPLVAIAGLTLFTFLAAVAVPTVGDKGKLPDSLPSLFWPDAPLSVDTLRIIAPYALAMALVGLLESLMTAKLVDDITDTHSNKTREAWGQGAANIITGFFGGMGGCAMIGQTMINVKVSGARTRLSTFLAGLFLLILVVGLGDLVAVIPMAALVAVMVMVSVGTFDWHSIQPATLRRMPRSENLVMLTTVIVVVATHNLAIGVVVGVLLSGIFFAWKIAQIFRVTSTLSDDGRARTYVVEGQVFFASVEDFNKAFDFKEVLEKVTIDVSRAHIWDISSVAALDLVVLKFRREGAEVEIIGLNQASETIVDKLAIHDKPGALERLLGH
jgi:SulP family sulfate permease